MKTIVSETIDGSIKDIIQLKTVDNSLEYSQMFDALQDTPRDFQTKLIDALNSLSQTMEIAPEDAFNQVLCASNEENQDVKKKLYNWWRAFFEVVSKSVPNIPEDRRQEYDERLDALISEICKAGDKASGNDVVLEDYEPADIEEEDKLKEDMAFAASKIGEVAKKAQELVNFLNPYCGTEVNESTMDETEVRDFVKAIGFRPDSNGIDYETQLVDALTGKDTSYNAGWGAVYYNSDKVLQFLKKYGMLGSRGIKQKEAISKLKRLFKSGKWKSPQQDELFNEVDNTMNEADDLGAKDISKLIWDSQDDEMEVLGSYPPKKDGTVKFDVFIKNNGQLGEHVSIDDIVGLAEDVFGDILRDTGWEFEVVPANEDNIVEMWNGSDFDGKVDVHNDQTRLGDSDGATFQITCIKANGQFNEVDSTVKKIDERGGSDWVSMDDMIGMEVGESDEEPINWDDENSYNDGGFERGMWVIWTDPDGGDESVWKILEMPKSEDDYFVLGQKDGSINEVPGWEIRPRDSDPEEYRESEDDDTLGEDGKKIAIANAKKTAKKDGYDQYILFDKSDNSWAFERKHIQTKEEFAKFGQEVVGIVRAEDLKFVPFAFESDDGGKAFWKDMDKVDDLEKKGYWKGIFKVGDKVSWIDPEYDEITSGWTVVSAPDEKDAEELSPEEAMYTIENDDGSEAEVLGSELRPAIDNLLGGNAEDLMISDMEGDDEDETEPLDEYEFLDKMLEDAEDTNDVFDVYDGNVIEDGTVALNVTVHKEDVEDGEVEAEFKDMPLKYGWEYDCFMYSSDVPGEEGTETIVVYFRPQKKRINEMSEIQDAEDFKDSLLSLNDEMFDPYDANTTDDGSVELNVVVHKESVSYGEVEKYFAPIAKKYGWKFVSFGYSDDMVDSIVDDDNCAIVVSFKKAEEKLDESDLENELAKGDDGWREIGQPIGEATVVVDANDVWDVLDLLDDEEANKNLTNLINSHVRTEEEIMDAIDTVYPDNIRKGELNLYMKDSFGEIVSELGLDVNKFKETGEFVDPEKPVALESDDDLLKVGDKVKVVGKGLASKGWVGEISSVDKAKKGLPYTVTFADRDPGEYAKDEVELVQEKDETPPDEVKDGEKKYKQDGETKTLDFGENKKPVCEMTIEQEVTDPWKLLELLWGQGKENFEELLRSNLFSDDRIMSTLEEFEVRDLTNLNDLLAFDFESVLEAFGCGTEAWTQHLEIQRA